MDSQTKGRILIIDDDQLIRTILTSVLETLGYDAETAASEEEGFDEYVKSCGGDWKYDLVIIDLYLNGKSTGAELLQKLREKDPSLLAIASSGHTDDPVMQDPGKYGFATAVSKPYSIRDLQEKIQSAMQGE